MKRRIPRLKIIKTKYGVIVFHNRASKTKKTSENDKTEVVHSEQIIQNTVHDPVHDNDVHISENIEKNN